MALKVAEKLGLDMVKLKADMASPEVKAEIDRVKELAKKMAINGTPHFLVGDRAIGGAPENLYELLGRLRGRPEEDRLHLLLSGRPARHPRAQR